MKEKRCRKCGRPIYIITRGLYRTVIVDPEAIEVIADPDGEQFIRIDGSKIQGKEAPVGILQLDAEWAYRPHRCGGRQ